jgi:RimJ/RimL family protein N-acetyltransferase
VGRVVAFLERHVDSSLFLLSNLEAHGPRLGEAQSSGNFRFLEEEGRVVAVFSLSRRGNLLLQAGDRHELGTELSRLALEQARVDGLELLGVLGPWETAIAAWSTIGARAGFRPGLISKEVLYAVDLPAPKAGEGSAHLAVAPSSRLLAERDFEAWRALNDAYLIEEHLPPPPGTPAARERGYREAVAARCWWGDFAAGELVSIVGLNARRAELGQVGGVFTTPSYRRRGHARLAMRALLRDSAELLGLCRVLLFTGESNLGARRLYESLGFSEVGTYALLLGAFAESGVE